MADIHASQESRSISHTRANFYTRMPESKIDGARDVRVTSRDALARFLGRASRRRCDGAGSDTLAITRGAHAGSRRMCKSDRARKSITRGSVPGWVTSSASRGEGGSWRHWRTFKSVMREIYCRRTVCMRSRCEWKSGCLNYWNRLEKKTIYASSLSSDVTEF